ncbi:MAG: hypothetical protein R3F61_02375 [Myxococcota bacterium]
MMLWLAVAWADCPAPTDNDAVEQAIEQVMAGFTAMDDRFESNRAALTEVTACLGEPIRPGLAAAVHRVEAFASFLDQKSEPTQLSFAAARLADPAYTLPDDIAPPGSPLRDDYDALDVTADVAEPLPALSGGTVWLDGKKAFQRSTFYPVFFQLQDPSGAITTSALVAAGQPLPLPAGAVKPPAPEVPEVPPEPVGRKRRPTVPLAVGAGVLAAATGGLLVGNRLSYGRYNEHYDSTLVGIADPAPGDLERYDELRSSTNTLGLGALGAGIGAVGLGVVAIAVSF